MNMEEIKTYAYQGILNLDQQIWLYEHAEIQKNLIERKNSIINSKYGNGMDMGYFKQQVIKILNREEIDHDLHETMSDGLFLGVLVRHLNTDFNIKEL